MLPSLLHCLLSFLRFLSCFQCLLAFLSVCVLDFACALLNLFDCVQTDYLDLTSACLSLFVSLCGFLLVLNKYFTGLNVLCLWYLQLGPPIPCVLFGTNVTLAYWTNTYFHVTSWNTFSVPSYRPRWCWWRILCERRCSSLSEYIGKMNSCPMSKQQVTHVSSSILI